MTIKIITFGCRLNTYESEVIDKLLKNKLPEDKNVILFNSCAVTSEAERQLRQAIRKAKKENRESVVGVLGCAAQVNKQAYEKMQEVDFVLGNHDKFALDNYIKCTCPKSKTSKNVIVSDILTLAELSPQLISGFDTRTRGFVQIQNGCDNECTFCITKFARGKSTSFPSKDIVEQIKKFVESGHNEVVLTGVNIADYGKRLAEDINLGRLVQKILKGTKLPRLRLSSIDVSEVDDKLMDILKHEPRLMPHLHLSLQSGDNTILKRMKRRHTREDVVVFCENLKKSREDMVFGADFIAGFPTETEEMHKNSLKLIKEAGIIFGHIFPYSVRSGTKAALMPQMNKKIRKRRAKELRDLTEKQMKDFTDTQIGKSHKVLIESENKGRTENYLLINLRSGHEDKVGEIVEIELKKSHLE